MEQIVDVPWPGGRISERNVEQIVDVPGSGWRIAKRIAEQIIDVPVSSGESDFWRCSCHVGKCGVARSRVFFSTFPRREEGATARRLSTANMQSHCQPSTRGAYEVQYVEYEGLTWGRWWDPDRQWHAWQLADSDGFPSGPSCMEGLVGAEFGPWGRRWRMRGRIRCIRLRGEEGVGLLFFCMLPLFALEIWTFNSSVLVKQSLARCPGCYTELSRGTTLCTGWSKATVVALRTNFANNLTFWLRSTEFTMSCKYRCFQSPCSRGRSTALHVSLGRFLGSGARLAYSLLLPRLQEGNSGIQEFQLFCVFFSCILRI